MILSQFLLPKKSGNDSGVFFGRRIFFFARDSSEYRRSYVKFKVGISSGDGRKSQGLPYKNAVVEFSFERLSGGSWSQYLCVDLKMARRTLVDMGAFCHFDA